MAKKKTEPRITIAVAIEIAIVELELRVNELEGAMEEKKTKANVYAEMIECLENMQAEI